MVERLEQASMSHGGALLREVHTLASAARSVGLLQAGNTAADIEQALARGEPDQERLIGLVALLHVSIDRLGAWEAAQQPAATEVS